MSSQLDTIIEAFTMIYDDLREHDSEYHYRTRPETFIAIGKARATVTEMKRIDLLDNLCKEFSASQKTIENRLSEIMKTEPQFINEKGQSCKLSKETKEKTVFYKLILCEA